MIIVTWQSGTRCSVCDDRDSALETVKDLVEGDFALDDVAAYDVRAVGIIKISIESWDPV